MVLPLVVLTSPLLALLTHSPFEEHVVLKTEELHVLFVKDRTILYEWRMKGAPMREAEHSDEVMAQFPSSRSLPSSGGNRHVNGHSHPRPWVQRRKLVQERGGSFLLAWPNFSFLHYLYWAGFGCCYFYNEERHIKKTIYPTQK